MTILRERNQASHLPFLVVDFPFLLVPFLCRVEGFHLQPRASLSTPSTRPPFHFVCRRISGSLLLFHLPLLAVCAPGTLSCLFPNNYRFVLDALCAVLRSSRISLVTRSTWKNHDDAKLFCGANIRSSPVKKHTVATRVETEIGEGSSEECLLLLEAIRGVISCLDVVWALELPFPLEKRSPTFH